MWFSFQVYPVLLAKQLGLIFLQVRAFFKFAPPCLMYLPASRPPLWLLLHRPLGKECSVPPNSGTSSITSVGPASQGNGQCPVVPHHLSSLPAAVLWGKLCATRSSKHSNKIQIHHICSTPLKQPSCNSIRKAIKFGGLFFFSFVELSFLLLCGLLPLDVSTYFLLLSILQTRQIAIARVTFIVWTLRLSSLSLLCGD